MNISDKEWVASPAGQAWIARVVAALLRRKDGKSYQDFKELANDMVDIASDNGIPVTRDDVYAVLEMAQERI
jgi:hypothetical protein